MPVQARRVQIIVTRDLIGRFPGSQPTVNLGALDMLAGTAFPRHDTYALRNSTPLRISARRLKKF